MNGRMTLAASVLLFCGIVVGAAFGVKSSGRAPEPEHELYPRAGIVTEIDRDADVVTFTDGSGNDWEFFGAEDWMIGDSVAAIMDDNGTAIVTDDVIVTVRYAG